MKAIVLLLLVPFSALAAGEHPLAVYNYMLYGSIFLLCFSVVILLFKNSKESKRNLLLNEIYNRERLGRGMIETRARIMLERINEELSIHNNEYNISMQIIQADLIKFNDLLHRDFAHLEEPEKILDEIASRFNRINEEVHSHESIALHEVEVRTIDDILTEAIHRHADRLRITNNEIYFIFNHDVINHETIQEEEFWFLLSESGKANQIFINNENGERIQAIISKSPGNTVEMFFVQNN